MESKSITRKQLLAWAMDKFDREAEELREGYKTVELLHSPVLTITLIREGTFQPCVDISNATGCMVYGEQSDPAEFYNALWMAYICGTAEGTL